MAAKSDIVEGATVGEIFENAVQKFVDPASLLIAPDDVTMSVANRLRAVVDAYGLESGQFVDFVAKYQKEELIRAGFYKVCKELAKTYQANKAATPPPVAATTEQPTAVQQ